VDAISVAEIADGIAKAKRTRQPDGHGRRDAAGLRAEHREAVREEHRFIDAVGDDSTVVRSRSQIAEVRNRLSSPPGYDMTTAVN
jgi:hypothetical protein